MLYHSCTLVTSTILGRSYDLFLLRELEVPNQVILIYLVYLTFILNFSVHPVVCPHLIGRYFNACNSIDNKNIMRHHDIALEKYLVTHSGYFRLETTVALGMGITYGELNYCHVVAEGNVGSKSSTLDYNNKTVYDCFNNIFTY